MYDKRFCKDFESIENYEKAKADNFKGWDVHHRLETHFSDGKRRDVDIRANELVAMGLYWNRPASELLFLTRAEHNRLHSRNKPGPMKGKHHSEEAKRKISEAHKGKHCTEVTKRKISEANKVKYVSEETRRKLSEAAKNRKRKKLSTDTRKKMSVARKGMRWYNNGIKNIRVKECPPGFVPGKLNRK